MNYSDSSVASYIVLENWFIVLTILKDLFNERENGPIIPDNKTIFNAIRAIF